MHFPSLITNCITCHVVHKTQNELHDMLCVLYKMHNDATCSSFCVLYKTHKRCYMTCYAFCKSCKMHYMTSHAFYKTQNELHDMLCVLYKTHNELHVASFCVLYKMHNELHDMLCILQDAKRTTWHVMHFTRRITNYHEMLCILQVL